MEDNSSLGYHIKILQFNGQIPHDHYNQRVQSNVNYSIQVHSDQQQTQINQDYYFIKEQNDDQIVSVTLQILVNDTIKSIGIIQINLDSYSQTINQQQEDKLQLMKFQFQNEAFLTFQITYTDQIQQYLKEVNQSQQNNQVLKKKIKIIRNKQGEQSRDELINKVEQLQKENYELREIKQNQDDLINQIKEQHEQKCVFYKAQIDDITNKYKHVLNIVRERQQVTQQNELDKYESNNTTDENISQIQKEYYQSESDEEIKQIETLEQSESQKYQALKERFKLLKKEKYQIEEKLVHAKMEWASLELECENLNAKVQNQQDKITSQQKEQRMLQEELVKTKQEMGEVLNQAYEYERVNQQLIQKVEQKE